MRVKIASVLLSMALLATTLLSACAGGAPPGPRPWQKADGNEQTKARDDGECREAARQEALRRYPYRGGSPSLGSTGSLVTQQRDESNRAISEASFFNDCMRGRGYQ